MIDAEEREARFYCGRSGCHAELPGLRVFTDGAIAPSGWWDILPDGPDGMTLLTWRVAPSRRRRSRRSWGVANATPPVRRYVASPLVVECPRCKARQRINVASPSQ